MFESSEALKLQYQFVSQTFSSYVLLAEELVQALWK